MNKGEECILAQSHQKQQAVDMTSGSIIRHLIVFTVPLLLGNLFQQLYNTVDSLVVGNFVGSEALAAESIEACCLAISACCLLLCHVNTKRMTPMISRPNSDFLSMFCA